MIAEKTNTAQWIIDAISASSGKVDFVSQEILGKALVRIEQAGIPTAKHEDYKYCNLDVILKKEFKEIKQDLITPSSIKDHILEDTVTLVVVNGNYSAELSDKVVLSGLHFTSLSEIDAIAKSKIGTVADPSEETFIALNTAFAGNGFHLRVEKNMDLQIPLHILYISTAETSAVIHPRNIITVEAGARATIIEHHLAPGKGKCFTNFVSEKFIAENAFLKTYTIQEEGSVSLSHNTNAVEMKSNSHYDNTTITLNGAVVRNNHNVLLKGKNSEAHLNGLFMTHDHQLVDNHTLMDHQLPHCESNELYKGVINDKSIGVFNGKIFVRKDAQKTNAYQSSKNILLSDDGTINTKPQLEIYADDVKCSHGTSTGKIDETALFYLNARGISDVAARKILLGAFAGEIIDKISIDSLKEYILKRLDL